MVFLNFLLIDGRIRILVNNNGYGSRRSKNLRVLRIRNTEENQTLPFAGGKPPAGEEKRLDHLPLQVGIHQLLPYIVLRVSGQEAEGVEVAGPPVQQLVRNVRLQVPAAEMSFIILERRNAALATRTQMRGTKLVSCRAANAYFE
jgi:hypothetical protein